MTKGHNQEPNNQEANQDGKKAKGENQHLKHQKRDDDPKGRNAEEDQSGGTKGKNSI